MSCLTSSDEIILGVGEILKVSMDFNENLDDGVTISTATPTCSPTGVTIASTSILLGIVYFTITSETVGNYLVSVEVTLSDGQTHIGEGSLKVRDR